MRNLYTFLYYSLGLALIYEKFFYFLHWFFNFNKSQIILKINSYYSNLKYTLAQSITQRKLKSVLQEDLFTELKGFLDKASYVLTEKIVNDKSIPFLF